MITVRNVNDALQEALWYIKVSGVNTGSRTGPVRQLPRPVMVTYTNPAERVLFSALRDANPFFHTMEAIWLLAGHDDVAFPARYAKQINAYSDDGLVLAGGYGHRWRRRFGIDQLLALVELLRKEHTTRRAVLQMWDCRTDMGAAVAGGLDVPCNTHIYFSAALCRLDMTVCCRSNDLVWGMCGANAFHFSMLQQFVAEACGFPIGYYMQFANNLHIYTERPDVQRLYTQQSDVAYVPDDRYAQQVIPIINLLQPQEKMEWFLEDAEHFLTDPDGDTLFHTEYFNGVVAPMQIAHTAYKAGDKAGALAACEHINAADLRIACTEWLGRRHA